MSKTVKLWCSQTKSNIEIPPGYSHQQILEAVQEELALEFATVYHDDAAKQIEDLETQVYTGQVLVVSSNPLERPQPYSLRLFVFYEGQELKDVMMDMEEWKVHPSS
jgi:hypothetical protein